MHGPGSGRDRSGWWQSTPVCCSGQQPQHFSSTDEAVFCSLEYPPPAGRTTLGHRSLLSLHAPFPASSTGRCLRNRTATNVILTHAPLRALPLPSPFPLPALSTISELYSHPPPAPAWRASAPYMRLEFVVVKWFGNGLQWSGNVVTGLEERGEAR